MLKQVTWEEFYYMYPMFKLYGFLLEIDVQKKEAMQTAKLAPCVWAKSRYVFVYGLCEEYIYLHRIFISHTYSTINTYIPVQDYFHMYDIISQHLP